MQNFLIRTFQASSTIALAVALAACGGDESSQQAKAALALPEMDSAAGWSMADLAAVDPKVFDEYDAPLPSALPLQASYDGGGYPVASAFDYAPDDGGYYEELDQSYYEPEPDYEDYSWLGLASSMSGMLGDAPPDYAFDYGGVEPWVWQTGDDYTRYAEPIDGGYRYYYYEPRAATPFLVSDPYYSYGYRGDRLVVIYDRGGRVIDGRRAWRQREAARSYYSRAYDMHRTAKRRDRHGVSAPLWDRHRDSVSRHRHDWREARERREQWREWDRRHETQLRREWASEGVVRRDAERRFDRWQAADYREEAPRFYRKQDRKAGLQRVAEVRERQRAKAREDRRVEVRAPAPSTIAYRQKAPRTPDMQRPETRQPETRREEPKRWTQRLRDLPEVARNDAAPPRPARAAVEERKPQVSRLDAAARREEAKRIEARQERSADLALERDKKRKAAQLARLEQRDRQVAEERQAAVRQERETRERQAAARREENRERARREAPEKDQARQAQQAAERSRVEQQAAKEKARQERVEQRQQQLAKERGEASEREARQAQARREAAQEQSRQAQADRKEELRQQRLEARQLAAAETRAEPPQARPQPQRQISPPAKAERGSKPERAQAQREKPHKEFSLKTGRALGKAD